MKYFIDTEFQQTDGPTGLFIMPISIGVVAEDGREFYAISGRLDPTLVDPWVRDHVLTMFYPDGLGQSPAHCDDAIIAADLKRFIGDDVPQFWGEYSAFDYVVLTAIMGGFEGWPQNWPMWINDLKQEAFPEVASQFPHNALADARAVRDAFVWATAAHPPIIRFQDEWRTLG